MQHAKLTETEADCGAASYHSYHYEHQLQYQTPALIKDL